MHGWEGGKTYSYSYSTATLQLQSLDDRTEVLVRSGYRWLHSLQVHTIGRCGGGQREPVLLGQVEGQSSDIDDDGDTDDDDGDIDDDGDTDDDGDDEHI